MTSKYINTRKLLPRPDNKIHLSKYGYSAKKKSSNRHAALKAAANDTDTLLVLRGLNLLINYQRLPSTKKIFDDDVEYMKNLYIREKKRRRSNKPTKRDYGQQHGGQNSDENSDEIYSDFSSKISNANLNGISPETSEADIEEINLPETEDDVITVNKITDIERVCDSDTGKCGIRNFIYEAHTVDSVTVVFYTLSKDDADDILKLDKIYLNPMATRDDILQKLSDNEGMLLGIKVDDKLQGYFQYEPIEISTELPTETNDNVQVISFFANPSYRTALYSFMEKFFQRNNYAKIIIEIKLDNDTAGKKINFWYGMGFVIDTVDPDDKRIVLGKEI